MKGLEDPHGVLDTLAAQTETAVPLLSGQGWNLNPNGFLDHSDTFTGILFPNLAPAVRGGTLTDLYRGLQQLTLTISTRQGAILYIAIIIVFRLYMVPRERSPDGL